MKNDAKCAEGKQSQSPAQSNLPQRNFNPTISALIRSIHDTSKSRSNTATTPSSSSSQTSVNVLMTSRKKMDSPRFLLHIEPPAAPSSASAAAALMCRDLMAAMDDAFKLSTVDSGGVPLTPNSSRRFSQFNFHLRRFSHTPTTLSRFGDSMGSLGHRALLQYVEANDLAGLCALLDSRHLSVDDRDENGTTLLMVVATRGLTPFVKDFLARGVNIDAEDNDNWTALLCATKAGHLEIVQLLLEQGADIEHRDMGGWTALMWASYRGHVQLVRFLLEHGADVNVHGNYHVGPLLWAAGRGFKEIVEMLLSNGAKVNVGDKYGTTALVWACRKGNIEIVDALLKAGANVDTAGMYSWTALLVATSGGHTDCVTSLLEKKPNVNALDKDGHTALAIASREGYLEIVTALITAGAYINIQDRVGDTPLIHAIKGGHRGVVEALLKKHADVDIQGKDRKTAIYTAVEKGHTQIVKILLQTNPDLETTTKDSDTALLRAVRNRNLEVVQMLLDRKAKVTASDKRSDTCLHIAMRARSKAIVEALLRNPKHSQLLYRANKAGETPYAIDTAHQKTILGQVFGARRLNTNEDSEGMLGYELYSSALADVLSEPTLTTPITVGLYAKWGSGKSFLLNKVRDEMINFAHQWAEPPVKVSGILFVMLLHIALVLGTIVGLSTWSLLWGSVAAIIFLVSTYAILGVVHYCNNQMDLSWAYSIDHSLGKRLGRLRLILQVAFCHPPGADSNSQAKPVRFHFAEASSASPTGEAAVAHMLALLFEAIESHYGWLATRLFRAFRPKPLKITAGWRFRRMCCVPTILIFELGLLTFIVGVSLVIAYTTQLVAVEMKERISVFIYVASVILITIICINLHPLTKAFGSLLISQSRRLKKTVSSGEGAPLTALGVEVTLMKDMVQCLDAFTNQQSRLVGVIDALDSCDTERIISLLNAIQTLLSCPNQPFVLLIAVDPHVIAKAVEANSRRLFTEGGIGGHDFLRNLVHLPVYLQNSGLRKVQRAQMTAMLFKRHCGETQVEEGATLGHSVSARRLSNASEIMSSQEKLRLGPYSSRSTGGGSSATKKMRLSESVASSIGSNLHRITQNPQNAFDLSRVVPTDDYFSDVNPRSMRRLLNVIYITVRLLKAFQIDFSWYRLSSWINLTEQWPLRASMIVLHHDQNMDAFEDTVPLQHVYEKVRPKLSYLHDAAPLLDLDRDERKLDAFLQLHKSDLLVADLRIFLPFTINLDPYLRKVLKEDQQTMEDESPIVVQPKSSTQAFVRAVPSSGANAVVNIQSPLGTYMPYELLNNDYNIPELRQRRLSPNTEAASTPLLNSPAESFGSDILTTILSDLTVEGIISLVDRVEDLKSALPKLAPVLRDNAISGRVLKYCDLNDLKQVLHLSFGHWELFRLLITTLRDCEIQQKQQQHQQQQQRKSKALLTNMSDTPSPAPLITTKDMTDKHAVQTNPSHNRKTAASQMEKQVTLEEQMICGALQTLNEDAYEDVASSERPSPIGLTADDDLQGTALVVGSNLMLPPPPSPSLQPHKDSILKQQGSIRSDKRVSIKANNNNNNNGKPPTHSNIEYISEKSTNEGKKRNGKPPSGARPASLVITKMEEANQAQIKLVRSSSVDYDDVESQQYTTTVQKSTNRTTLLEQLQEDESAPLVFTVHK